jgi:hypothetical protein
VRLGLLESIAGEACQRQDTLAFGGGLFEFVDDEEQARLGLVDGYFDIRIDYPPLGLAFLNGVALVSREVGVTLFAGVKASLLLALLVTALVYWAVSRNLPLATGLLVALIPCSVSLGYLDVYYAPFLLLALFSLERGRWEHF